MASLNNLYQRYRPSIVRIDVRNRHGDSSIGTGFHVGDGLIVTARHVLRETIRTPDIVGSRDEEIDRTVTSITRDVDKKPLLATAVHYHVDQRVDLAVLETDMETYAFSDPITGRSLAKGYKTAIPVGAPIDAWIRDHMILNKVLIMGYPKVPWAVESVLVTAEAEINALVQSVRVPHPYYVLSATARGGFSGAPVINEDGHAVGVIVESLYGDNKPEETGFNSAITMEPLIRILANRGPRPLWIPSDIWERFSID